MKGVAPALNIYMVQLTEEQHKAVPKSRPKRTDGKEVPSEFREEWDEQGLMCR